MFKIFILSDLFNFCNGMNCFKYSVYVNLLSLKHNSTVLNLILSFLGAVVKLPTKCERDNPVMVVQIVHLQQRLELSSCCLFYAGHCDSFSFENNIDFCTELYF